MLVGTVAALIVAVTVIRRVRHGGWAVDRRSLLTGLLLVAVAIAAGIAVRVANDGHPPATVDAWRAAGRTTTDASGRPVPELRDRQLLALGHVVAWPAPLPLATPLGLPELGALAGLALALRRPRRPRVATRLELVTGQLWWAAPVGGERLELVVPGAVLRADAARFGLDLGPRGGVVIVVDGPLWVHGTESDVITVEDGHGLALTPDGPSGPPEVVHAEELAADPWIGPRLDEPPRPEQGTFRREPRAWPLGALAVVVVLAALVVGTYVAQVTRVPDRSMAPTLASGDRVVVTKVGDAPQAADIVAFERPTGATTGHRVLVQRVVAVGGQIVRLADGRVHVDGEPLAEPYLRPGTRTEATCDDRPEVLRVPVGAVYVLGDDRADAYDSRCFGAVPRDRLIGQVAAGAQPPGRVR